MKEKPAASPAPSENDACVVGCGAMLPQAGGAEAFWGHLLAGKSLIRPIPRQRWPLDSYQVPAEARGQSPDKLYSSHSGWIDDRAIEDARLRLKPPVPFGNRLHVMALAAADEALRGVGRQGIEPQRCALILGCMDQDESLVRLRFRSDEEDALRRKLGAWPKPQVEAAIAAIGSHYEPHPSGYETYRSALLTTSVLGLLSSRLGFAGEAALVDAACASSLAALDQAVDVLRSGQADLVLSGGIESNLGPETFVLFSRIGALAAGQCRPLDARADGLNQGEGAVLFALKRLGDARRAGDPILGILRSFGSSSDGRQTSLFEPAADGQRLALERAYAGLDRDHVAYLECHGTGTPVGDRTELAAANRFFGSRELPIGSSKALVGHTKGAAGAVGLLKGLLALKNGVFPPMPDCEMAAIPDSGLRVNALPEPVPAGNAPLYFGISSFGFGGVNYHLVLERHEPGAPPGAAPGRTPGLGIVLCGSERSQSGASAPEGFSRFHIPPRSIAQIDLLQLDALTAADLLLRRLAIGPGDLDRDRICVVSAGCLGTASSVAFGVRVLHHELPLALAGFEPELVACAVESRRRHPEVTEDTGPGILNNVVAGRVANAFDFRGCSFNVDADFASLPVALRRAESLLGRGAQAVLVLAADEALPPMGRSVLRRGVVCSLVTTAAEAWRLGLPCEAVIAATLEEGFAP